MTLIRSKTYQLLAIPVRESAQHILQGLRGRNPFVLRRAQQTLIY